MRVLIVDANIFIDLLLVNSIDLLFQFCLEVHTTSFVMAELEIDQQAEIIKRGVVIHIEGLLPNEKFNKGLSLADISVISLALRFPATVLTGDSLVRSTCHTLHIEVHGILWFLDQCISLKILTSETAFKCLNEIMEINKWLPVRICEEYLKKWSRI